MVLDCRPERVSREKAKRIINEEYLKKEVFKVLKGRFDGAFESLDDLSVEDLLVEGSVCVRAVDKKTGLEIVFVLPLG